MIQVGDTLPAGSLKEFIEVEGNGCSIGPNSFDNRQTYQRPPTSRTARSPAALLSP